MQISECLLYGESLKVWVRTKGLEELHKKRREKDSK